MSRDRDDGVPIEEWGLRIYDARLARRISQAKLARSAGVTQQTISRIENGEQCPTDALKARLARALQVEPSELFPWQPSPVAKPER